MLPQQAVTRAAPPSRAASYGGPRSPAASSRSCLSSGMSGLSALAGAGRLQDERHARRSPGGRRARRTRRRRCGPRRCFWWRSLKAPRTSIESLACTSRSRPGPPISTIRSTVAVVPPGSSSGAPAAKTWQVSRQIPALGWWSRASRYGARSSTPAHRDRPWPAVGSSSSHGAASSATASSRAAVPRGPASSPRRSSPCWSPSLGSTYDPVCTTTPSAPISAARLRLWATEATEFSYVAGVGEPRLTRYGAWMKARVPRSAIRSRNRASSAGLPALSAQPRGLPTKIWKVSQPTSSALATAPSTRPLPTRTWVPIGLRRQARAPDNLSGASGSDQREGDRRAWVRTSSPPPGLCEKTNPSPS